MFDESSSGPNFTFVVKVKDWVVPAERRSGNAMDVCWRIVLTIRIPRDATDVFCRIVYTILRPGMTVDVCRGIVLTIGRCRSAMDVCPKMAIWRSKITTNVCRRISMTERHSRGTSSSHVSVWKLTHMIKSQLQCSRVV
jgi:hypothetical protein